MKHILFFCFFILSLSPAAQANYKIVLHGINYPVWVDRDQKLSPLSPGAELFPGDIITTGKFGRAWLSMPDGSIFKIGQNSRFEINNADFHVVDDTSLLDATLNVIKGAFRFTSGFFNTNFNSNHKVKINIGAITIGIRGTDIWGHSTSQEDFVTLLEGTISLETESEGLTILGQPLTAYRKLKDQPADPILKLELHQVQKLALETELSEEQGISKVEGKFDLILMSLKNYSRAQQEVSRFQQSGYAVSTESKEINGALFTRLILPGFISSKAAYNQSKSLVERFQLENIWVRKQNP